MKKYTPSEELEMWSKVLGIKTKPEQRCRLCELREKEDCSSDQEEQENLNGSKNEESRK